ncbi:MAG: hypothetical protein SA378_07330 [Sedimentibacter sp.]|uniref:hypothetical protein n=1 Tax=Sedimentibacter sp. TaxID=1960295 RepID=UPI002980E43E|nr:hypothetical protein [Sedimentibacter sp.]MDW5299931.1 hypothetical protein [Sedimentibacter sp.]
MKKSRLLALTLVVAVMLVGAGYAYWGEALTINTTVDTGDLEVLFIEPATVTEGSIYQPNADCTPIENGKGMQVTFKEAFPGLTSDLEFTLTNVGTLKAYVDDFSISNATKGFNTNLILCNGIEIDGKPTGFNYGTLAEALAFINEDYGSGKGIAVDTELVDKSSEQNFDYNYNEGTTKVKFELEFSSEANNKNFHQDNVIGNEDANYSFTINAKVQQFNEPEKVIE